MYIILMGTFNICCMNIMATLYVIRGIINMIYCMNSYSTSQTQEPSNFGDSLCDSLSNLCTALLGQALTS